MRLFKIRDFGWALGKSKARVGEVHDWSGKRMQKMPDGTWREVKGQPKTFPGQHVKDKVNDALKLSEKRLDALAKITYDMDDMAGKIYDYLEEHGKDIPEKEQDKIINSVHSAVKQAGNMMGKFKWEDKKDIEQWRKDIAAARDTLADAWKQIYNHITGKK